MELATLLNWSAPNRNGNRSAEPNGAFWNLWRSDKAGMKSLGVSVTREDSTGKWTAWWNPAKVRGVPLASSEAEAVSNRPAQPPPEPPAYMQPEDGAVVTDNVSFDPAGRWSVEQRGIFVWFEAGTCNLVVRARAGTGKTTTIIEALSYVPSEVLRIVYVVFNKKNAVEAERKVRDPRVEVLTLHAAGFRMIRQVWPNSKPNDDVEEDRVVAICGAEVDAEVRSQIVKLVGFAKNLSTNPDLDDMVEIADARMIECPNHEAPERGNWTVEKLSGAALAVLELSKAKDEQNRISFNDMVWLPVAMGWVRKWWQLVVVDEAQDMNLPQLLMAMQMVEDGGRVCVVGDDRQAIYGFRGATSNGLDMMKRELGAIELGLTTTYRCPKSVVEIASEFVPDYRAADSAPDGEVFEVQYDRLAQTATPGDAVLSRANASLMPMCLSFLRAGIPARVEGRDIGRALLGMVRKFKAKSVPDLLERISKWETKQVDRAVKRGGRAMEDKIEQIRDQAETLSAIAEGMPSVTAVESRITTLFDDSSSNSSPSVVFSTVHKAKGLEWGRVFVLRETFLRRKTVEEENIFYVAVTRSKRSLGFIGASGRDRKPKEEKAAA